MAESSGRRTESDWAVVLEIPGEIDRGHAARTERALESVTLGQGGL
jgi:hypothetical protein